MPRTISISLLLYVKSIKLYLSAATYRSWYFLNTNLPTQILPFLELILVGIAAIESSEAEGLAFAPAFSLQFFTPSTSSCKAIEVTLEAAGRFVYEPGISRKPIAYWSCWGWFDSSHDDRKSAEFDRCSIPVLITREVALFDEKNSRC